MTLKPSHSILLAFLFVGCEAARKAPQESFQVLGLFEQQQRGAIVASPCVTADRIFLNCIIDEGSNSRGRIVCLDRTSLSEIWTFDANRNMLHSFSTPAVRDGKVYFGEGMHGNFACSFYCLDAQLGTQVWRTRTRGHIESSPMATNGRVYVCSGDDGLYCWDSATGKEIWHYDGGMHLDSNPCIAQGLVFVGAGVSKKLDKTAVIALSADSGKVAWKTSTPLPAWGSPVVDRGEVFVGLGNGRLDRSVEPPEKRAGALLCLEVETGVKKWQYDVGDGVLASPGFDVDSVYFGSRDSHVYCVDRGSQKLAWKTKVGSAVLTTPAAHGNKVYVAASGGQILALDKNSGKPIAVFDLGQHTQSSAVLLATPILEREENKAPRLFVTGSLRSPVSSAAILIMLLDRS